MLGVLAGSLALVTAWEGGWQSKAGGAVALLLPAGGEAFRAHLGQGKSEPAFSLLGPQELPVRAGGVHGVLRVLGRPSL